MARKNTRCVRCDAKDRRIAHLQDVNKDLNSKVDESFISDMEAKLSNLEGKNMLLELQVDDQEKRAKGFYDRMISALDERDNIASSARFWRISAYVSTILLIISVCIGISLTA